MKPKIMRGLEQMKEFYAAAHPVQEYCPVTFPNGAKWEGVTWKCYTCETVAPMPNMRGLVVPHGTGVRVDAVVHCEECNSYAACLFDVLPTEKSFDFHMHPNVEARAKYTQRRRGISL